MSKKLISTFLSLIMMSQPFVVTRCFASDSNDISKSKKTTKKLLSRIGLAGIPIVSGVGILSLLIAHNSSGENSNGSASDAQSSDEQADNSGLSNDAEPVNEPQIAYVPVPPESDAGLSASIDLNRPDDAQVDWSTFSPDPAELAAAQADLGRAAAASGALNENLDSKHDDKPENGSDADSDDEDENDYEALRVIEDLTEVSPDPIDDEDKSQTDDSSIELSEGKKESDSSDLADDKHDESAKEDDSSKEDDDGEPLPDADPLNVSQIDLSTCSSAIIDELVSEDEIKPENGSDADSDDEDEDENDYEALKVKEDLTEISPYSAEDSDFPDYVYDCQQDKDAFHTHLMKLLDEAEEKLIMEHSLVEVEGPAIIVGDIHGNIDALRYCENYFEQRVAAGYSIIFLGDYVDRGGNSLECVALLMSLKNKYPKNVFLLRGNHEDKAVNWQTGGRIKTFRDEVYSHYGNKCSYDIMERVNAVFKRLPLAAVLKSGSERMFCVHGGICDKLNSLDDVRKISRPCDVHHSLYDVELPCGLLWSDPGEGTFEFNPNVIRGAGQIYGRCAVDKFLSSNNLTRIVRAHQQKRKGYAEHWGGKVITMFSSPNYCGTGNKGCIMDVDAMGRYQFVEIR